MRELHGRDVDVIELEGRGGRYDRVKRPEPPLPAWNVYLLAFPSAVILAAFLAFCGLFLAGNLVILGFILKNLFT